MDTASKAGINYNPVGGAIVFFQPRVSLADSDAVAIKNAVLLVVFVVSLGENCPEMVSYVVVAPLGVVASIDVTKMRANLVSVGNLAVSVLLANPTTL